MKIAHIVDSMELGGAEMLVSQMCRLQRELGHDPCVYAIAGLGVLGEKLLDTGFTVQANVGRHLADSARAFYKIFRQTRPDAVHLHNSTPTIYAAAPARLAGVACIVSTRHGMALPSHRKITELKYSAAAICCNWITGVCDATTDQLKSVHGASAHKIVRVYNGVMPLSRVAPDGWPLKSGFTLLYVGRLARVKNLAMLLGAFRDALARMPGLRLWIVGDGDERARLEGMVVEFGISDQDTFYGQQLDVAPFFSAADAFVMSSVSEGLPVSLLQAFSLGLPAIVTDVDGMGEAVRLARAGFPVSPGSAAEMAAAIVRLAGGAAEREQFSSNAHAAFQQHFTLPAMVESYTKLYRGGVRVRAVPR